MSREYERYIHTHTYTHPHTYKHTHYHIYIYACLLFVSAKKHLVTHDAKPDFAQHHHYIHHIHQPRPVSKKTYSDDEQVHCRLLQHKNSILMAI